jgi:hypothetical protein
VRSLVLVCLVGALAVGCQQSPTASRKTTPAVPLGSRTAQLVAEGDALASRENWAGAAVKYQAALNDARNDVGIRFALASTLTHLDRRDEAIEHFKVVVTRGKPGSAEVRMAREWLASAAALDGSVPSPETAATEPATQAPPQMAPTMSATTGRVHGKLEYQSINPRERRTPVRITLSGEDVANRDVKKSRGDFKIGRNYEFNQLPPGTYTLLAEAGGTRMWEQRVTVEASKAIVVDLTDGNAVAPANFTPTED